ncbi:MAG: PAC2 family protein [Acidimicrobiia bacterium]
MNDPVEWIDPSVSLHRPVLLAAFDGWNDAANAATGAIDWILAHSDSAMVARIDPEEFFDFQAHRPHIEIVDGDARRVRWPANEFHAVRSGDRDLVVLRGTEPSHRWRTFTRTVLDVAQHFGCEEACTFGALLADVPHTRAPLVTAVANDPGVAARLGLDQSRYEGPTGIVGVLHDAARTIDLRSVSLWVPVPHYLQAPPNPVATRALLDRFSALTGFTVGRSELDDLSDAWLDRVAELVSADDEVREYVETLEDQDEDYDSEYEEREVPSGESIAAELEQFLRERDDL